MGWVCSRRGSDKKTHAIFCVGRWEGGRPLGRPRRGWDSDIERTFKSIGVGLYEC